MSEEPARPEGVVEGGEAGEAQPQADQPNEPTQPLVQEPEMAAVSNVVPEVAAVPVVEPNPEEEKPEAVLPEKMDQEEAQKEPSVAAAQAPVVAAQPSVEAAQPSVEAAQPSAAAVQSAVANNAASEFPLADNKVLAELKALESRAREAAKAIEALKEQLAANAKKDVMTKDDMKLMEQKQKELMDKMQEFEEITKKVQQLVGLVEVASSQLGPPQKPMVPSLEGAKTGSSKQPKSAPPNEILPKVIICGTNDVDEVPKIIVCEPTSAKHGKQPLYQQIKNDTITGKDPSNTKAVDTKGSSKQDQIVSFAPVPTNQLPYMGQGYPGYPGGPVRPFGDGSHNMEMMQLGIGQAGMMHPGMGQAGMMQPGMGQAGMMPPGMGQARMMQPGMMQLGMGQAGMMQPGIGQAGMMQPGMGLAGMMQPGIGQAGIMCPGMGQPGMMQPRMGQCGMMQPGMVQPNMMQPWMAQPGVMQYGPMQPGMTQFGMGQPSVTPGICCNQCGRPKKKSNEQNAGPGQKTKHDGSDIKKSCQKRKQCYCQISGLCQLNKSPYPTT